ncbi:MAG: efflux RND transporter periplasmic adaptor subunit [Chlamydiota bacterium]
MGKGIISFLVALVLMSCSSDQTKKERPPPSVEVGKVIQKDVPIYIDAVGNIGAWYTIDIRSQVTGVLEESHVAEGQEVKVGQLIYTIDPAPYQASLEKADAQLREDMASLRLAEDKALRYKDLAKDDYISQLNYDELLTNVELMKAKVDVDKAEIEEARIQLEYCYIRSPVNGKISYNVLDPGNLVTANSENPLTSVRQMDPILVDFTIPQKDFLKLQHQHEGEETKFLYHMLDTDGNKITKEGTVYFIDNNFDLNTGTILLKGKIENQDYSLWPGEFGKVQLVVRTVKDGILVPQSAIQVGQKGEYVFVLQDDKTVKVQNINPVELLDGYFLIKEGLKPGDTVITNGQVNLRPGMKVQVKQSDTKDSGKEKKKAE